MITLGAYSGFIARGKPIFGTVSAWGNSDVSSLLLQQLND